jgi:hypothetical protein
MTNPAQTVNVAVTNVFNGVLKEANPPIFPWGNSFLPIGAPTTPGLARGYLANTGVYFTNSDVSHACDVRFNLNLNFSLTELTLPNLGILAGGIQNGKMAAAKAVRAAMQQVIGEFRIAVKAIIITLNTDPSGEMSKSFSTLKKNVRLINEKLTQASQKAADISFVYYLIQDIEQIVQWISTLPDKLRKMIQSCFINFTNSLATAKSQISGTLAQTQASLNQSLNSSISASQSANASAAGDVSPELLSAVSDPVNANASAIGSFLSAQSDAASSTLAKTQAALSSNTGSP